MESLEVTNYRKILEAAARLFSEKGYANVSIRDLCKETGTTPPMIYYYFGSKKGLFDAVIRERISMKDFIKKLREASELSNARDSFFSYIDTYLRFFPDSAFDIGLYITDKASLDEKSTSMIEKDLNEVTGILHSIVKKCVRQGIMRKIDTRNVTECIIGMLNHPIFQRIHFQRKADIQDYKEVMLEIVQSSLFYNRTKIN